MQNLTTTERYVLAQLLVSGHLHEGELREASDMTFRTLEKACGGLRDKGFIGNSGVVEDPFAGSLTLETQTVW